MARAKAAKPHAIASPLLNPAEVRADRLELVALLGLLSLIPIRTFVSESHDFATAAWFRNITPQTTAMPGHTYIFIAVIVMSAALVMFSKWARGIGWQSTGLLPGGALLAIAAAISTQRAGQKHLAIIGSLDFLAMLSYAATLRQLLNDSWRQRLAMSIIVATGAAVVIKCGIQKWIELPATVQLFNEQYRAAMAYGQEDPGRLYDFEQRLKSGAVTAYFSHANVLAGYLILIVMAALGVASVRLKRAAGVGNAVFNKSAIAPATVAALAGVMLVFTQSKGGAAAAVGAIALWGMGRAIRLAPTLAKNVTPLRVAAAIWLGLVALAAGVVMLLSRNPEALGRSILFRWLYWKGAADMLRGEGWWGVGANNFGRFFTRYKPIICPEDVQDPHSWIIRALTEWGAMGLIALLISWIGWSMVLAQRWEPWPEISGLNRHGLAPQSSSPRHASIGVWALILSLATGVAWTIVSWRGGAELWEQTVLIAVACWLACFLVVSIENRQERQFSAATRAVDPWALIAGLVGFLIHAAIDIELFWAGPATTFVALAAVAQASSGPPAPEVTRSSKLMPAMAWMGCLIGILIAVCLAGPAWRTGSRLDEARIAPRPATWRDYHLSTAPRLYETAMERYPLDGTAIDELSLELTARIETVDHCDRIMPLLDEWRLRDPHNNAIDQRKSAVLARRFTLSGSPQDLDAAIAHMERAVAANPSAPQRRLAIAQLYELKSQREPAARKDAVAAFQKALDLDDQRILVSKPNRMTPEIRNRIRERIEQLGR